MLNDLPCCVYRFLLRGEYPVHMYLSTTGQGPELTNRLRPSGPHCAGTFSGAPLHNQLVAFLRHEHRGAFLLDDPSVVAGNNVCGFRRHSADRPLPDYIPILFWLRVGTIRLNHDLSAGYPMVPSVDVLSGFLVVLRRRKRRRCPDCSRFCSGQSTQEPQGSTRIGTQTVNSSIKSTYFNSISIGFNKSFDLFWEQMECPQ